MAEHADDVHAFLSIAGHGPNAYVSLLGLKTFDSDKLVRTVETGLSFRAFERFRRNFGVATAVMSDVMDLAGRTLTRRRKQGRLSPDESDKLLRITRLFAKALVLFEGDATAARKWLSSTQRAAGGAVPLDLARTEVGAREVERLLGRMEHGVVSQVPTGWRIVKAKHAANAFDGEGARINGGRWNSPGTSVIYTSESRALATLELLVHLNDSALLPRYVLIPCTFASRYVVRVEALGPLPHDWAAYPAPASLQALGDSWARSGSSVVLSVPSAVTENERNYVLNPSHPSFPAVKIGAPVPLKLDERLLGKRRKRQRMGTRAHREA